jgi:hypothetical protein
MKRFSLGYTLLTARFDQVWFPLTFWVLFMIIGFLRGQDYIMDTTRSYLGVVIPLIGGIMAAYAVLDDPALELRFATPISAAQTLIERLGPTFLVQVFAAFSFQIFALFLSADFSVLGSWSDVQLAWLVPTLALMGLGCVGALVSAKTITGALLVGTVWIVELVARGLFAGNQLGQYILIFMGPLMPDHPALHANQICILFLSVVFFFLGWRLFHLQERYI